MYLEFSIFTRRVSSSLRTVRDICITMDTIAELPLGQYPVRSRGLTECIHHKKVLELYCKDCQDLACIKCVTSLHKTHDFCDLKDILTGAMEEIKTFIVDTEEIEFPNIQQAIISAKDILKMDTSKFDYLEKEVTKQVEKLKRELELLSDNIRSSYQQIRKENKDVITGYIKALETRQENFSKCLNESKKVLQSGLPVNIFDVRNTIRSLKPLLPEKPTLGTAVFSPNKLPLDLLTKSFGTLATSHPRNQSLVYVEHTTGQHQSPTSQQRSTGHHQSPSTQQQSTGHHQSPTTQQQSTGHHQSLTTQKQSYGHHQSPTTQKQSTGHHQSPTTRKQSTGHHQSPTTQQSTGHHQSPAIQQQSTGHHQSPATQQQSTGHHQSPTTQQQSSGHHQSPNKQQSTGHHQSPTTQQQSSGHHQSPTTQQQSSGHHQSPNTQQSTGHHQSPTTQQQSTGHHQSPTTQKQSTGHHQSPTTQQQSTGHHQSPTTQQQSTGHHQSPTTQQQSSGHHQSPTTQQHSAGHNQPLYTQQSSKTKDRTQYRILSETKVVGEFDSPCFVSAICPTNDEQIYTMFNRKVTLLNKKGEVQHEIKYEILITDVSLSPATQNVWTSSEYCSVMEYGPSHSPVVRFDTPNKPWCLCVMVDQNVLIGISKQITQYSIEGEILLTTSSSQCGQSVVKSPRRITECRVTHNIAVVDRDYKDDGGDGKPHVLVFDKNLKEVFRYTGDIPVEYQQTVKRRQNIFDPRDVRYDIVGNLVISDRNRYCVHLINGVGDYLRLIYTNDTWVGSIGIGVNNELWVKTGSIVKLLKYSDTDA